MSKPRPVLVLFRNDLRLDDNRALAAAAATGRPVIPLFILDEVSVGTRPLGAARRWWLHHSLLALAQALAALGSRLVVRRGETSAVADAVVSETGADMVLWNRRYDLSGRNADARMKSTLKSSAVEASSFDGFLLHEPWRMKTGGGTPFKVFTPFWRALQSVGVPRDPADPPKALVSPATWPTSLFIADLDLLPRGPDWTSGLAAQWTPGETGAQARLATFVSTALDGYGANRDRPDIESTSRLSPHLANGEISPFRIWAAVEEAKAAPVDRAKFLSELGWREFSWHLLFHRPDLGEVNFDKRFDALAWQGGGVDLAAWQKGETGYPIIDAGMRQLWATGWMHNRVRMVAASFLTKHLLIDWREGERWFWDTLVDADPASNAASWQWVAGPGADAAPYFRIFNPVLQGQKFDPEGAYVRNWIRELEDMSGTAIHEPSVAGRAPGYPQAIVDHQFARNRALDAFAQIRGRDD
jgi:deoxyribodipyrimidine photo-lyase